MKSYVVYFGIILGSLISVSVAYASLTQKPIGGKIISTQQGGVTCTSQYGPISIKAPRGFKTSYFIMQETDKQISNNKWFLGFYSSIVDSETCYTGEAPERVPFKTYRLQNKPFGIN